jgi:hypothetical protein
LPNETSLAENALLRLQKLAAGNGLNPALIQIAEKNERTTTLTGELHLNPRFDSQIKDGVGAFKNKSLRVLGSFEALDAEIANRKSAFETSKTLVQDVLNELEADPSHGWGQQDALVALPSHSATIGATSACPECGGKGLLVCGHCRGEKMIFCLYCEGRKQEPCYQCNGSGQDAANQPCPVCHGTRFAPCRYCHAMGMVACPTCAGRGGTPCAACRGSGKLSRLATIKAGTATSFQMKNTTDLPSGLLRNLDRLGIANLGKGHADIAILPQEAEADPKILHLRATFPYADVKIRIGKSLFALTVFGKKGLISGAPAFLDAALKPARAALAEAASGSSKALDKAMETRAIREAITLVLEGKKNTNDLRRLYPIGLSPQVAQEIMIAANKSLRVMTRGLRIGIGALCFGLSVGAFAGFFLTPLKAMLGASPPLASAAKILLPILALGLSWFALNHATKWKLHVRVPRATPHFVQDIGLIGKGALAAIAFFYAALLFLFR